MNRYRLHESKAENVWQKYYPGLKLIHKKNHIKYLILVESLIGPIDGKDYWKCNTSWPTNQKIYSVEDLDDYHE